MNSQTKFVGRGIVAALGSFWPELSELHFARASMRSLSPHLSGWKPGWPHGDMAYGYSQATHIPSDKLGLGWSDAVTETLCLC